MTRTKRKSGAGFKTKHGLLISSNSKTGLSINLSLDTCKPDPWCLIHCYARRRKKGTTCMQGWKPGANTGPITWPVQQKAYARNVAVLMAAQQAGTTEELAIEAARRIKNKGFQVIRGNGCGDITPPVALFYAYLGKHGVHVYLYSRKPKDIRRLTGYCKEIGLPRKKWPYVLASMDPSTSYGDVLDRIDASRQHNGKVVLVLAVNDKFQAKNLMSHLPISVVFGYHSSVEKTTLGMDLECPATAGQDIKCHDCRICFGPHAPQPKEPCAQEERKTVKATPRA
jgi:hypothetical protein